MNAIVEYKDPAIEDVKRLANLVLALRDEVFHEGQDFGVIPGTNDKPVLLLPGMEKLLRALNLRPEYVPLSLIEDFDRPLFFYRYECRLVEVDTGRVISTAIGSANSRESKWRWRNAERVCPHCGKSAIIRGKAEYGGGWLCFAKKGGCGAKFGDNDPAIAGQEVGRIENPDIADQMNTIDKIAQKRALASAIKGAANVSQFFTVDLEDFQPHDVTPVVVNGHASVLPDTVFSAKAALEEFLEYWGGQSLSTADLREALLTAQPGMGHWREWAGNRAAADAAVRAWLEAQMEPDADVLAAKLEAADIADTPDPFADDAPAPLGKADAQKLTKWAYKQYGLSYKDLVGHLGLEFGVDVSAFLGTYRDAQDIVTAAMAEAVQP